MTHWRAEYDDGLWRFYRDGIELHYSVDGGIVVDALNKAEARIAELEATIEELIEAGNAMSNAQSMWVAEEDVWDALVKDWEKEAR